MVRLLIPLVAIVLIWLLFFSSFSKRIRIIATAALIVITVFGLWLDTNGRAINTSRIQASEVESCGVSGAFSYRTNFNLDLCLQNNSAHATVKRLELNIEALDCESGTCEVADSRTEVINITIASGQRVQHVENVSFPLLSKELPDPVFTAQVTQVWASR